MRDQAEIAEEILTKKLRKTVFKAVTDYHMIKDGDKIMVCLSGGKDSYTMLDIMMYMEQIPHNNFEIIAVNLDQKQPDFPEHILPAYLEKLRVPYKIIERDTYSIVKEKIPEGKTMCSLCSRLRRSTLYDVANEIGANKLALGHHREDILETFFLNLFFAGKIETMPPKYETNNGGIEVIRPLAYCKEADIIEFAKMKEYPIIPCNLCGTQTNMQRQVVKGMISKWEGQYANRTEIMFNAMKNISPTHMLDRDLFDFEKLVPGNKLDVVDPIKQLG